MLDDMPRQLLCAPVSVYLPQLLLKRLLKRIPSSVSREQRSLRKLRYLVSDIQ